MQLFRVFSFSIGRQNCSHGQQLQCSLQEQAADHMLATMHIISP